MTSNGKSSMDIVSAALAGSSSLLPGEVGADAQADLAQALIRSTVQVNAAGLRELMFIRLYAGEQGVLFVDQLLRDKAHQNPGALKRFTEAIKALALFDHLKGFNLNLGGK
jgi:hypothetical protein